MTRGSRLWSVLCVLSFAAPVVFARSESGNSPQIIRLDAGIHRLDQRLLLERPHAVLEGQGPGVTILVAPDGVLAVGPNSIIRNVTIIGRGSGVGLLLRDTWSASIENVEIENFQTGLLVELTDEGRRRAGGRTMNGWPSALTGGDHWGSRVTLTSIRNLEVTGPGDGIVLVNRLKSSKTGNFSAATDQRLPGEFFTGTTIWGGHIYVQGRAVTIGDGVWSTKLIGTYIDISGGGGIDVKYGAQWVNLVAVNLDRNPAAREKNLPKITVSSRSRNTLQIVASDELGESDVISTDP